MAKVETLGNDIEIGSEIVFVDYQDESRLEDVDRLVACDLSEPYSIFTYRYFLNRFPDLCILARDPASGEICGCVVGKIDTEDAPAGAEQTPQSVIQTGYIGMLAVNKSHRRKGIGKDLVRCVLQRMKNRGCDSVTLETVSLDKLCEGNVFEFCSILIPTIMGGLS